MSMESFSERQENEFQVLKAIFNEELVDMRQGSSKYLDILITLSPLQDSKGLTEAYTQIGLRVTAPESYPDTVPQIDVVKPKGLSDQLVATLKGELNKLAVTRIGEVMVYDLAIHAQMFLLKHNKPGTKSFYEEMLLRRTEEQKHQFEIKKLIEDRERLAIQQEIQRKEEVIKEEVRFRREQKLSTSSQFDPSNDNSSESNESGDKSTSQGLQCEHKCTKYITFVNNGRRSVHRGTCLGHSSTGSIVYNGIDTDTGEMVAIREWRLNCRDNKTDITSGIGRIFQEYKYLKRFSHENIVNYVDASQTCDRDDMIVYIVQEFVLGLNLENYQNRNLDIRFARHFTLGILKALNFLHERNITHKDVKESCVYINRTGTVKLANHSLYKRMYDLYRLSHREIVSTSYDGLSRKSEIFKLGLILLKFLKCGQYEDEACPYIPDSLPADVKDFLTKCLVKDEDKRWNTKQLLEHSFVKQTISKHISGCEDDVDVNQYKQTSVDVRNNIVDDDGFQFTMSGVVKGQSRFNNEFEVLDYLGHGAYGNVYKAQNNLDRRIYAIKQMKINPKNIQLNKKITREVELLSKLNHENVVRYFNSWVESATITDADTDNTSSSMCTSPDQRGVDPQSLAVFNSIEANAPPLKDVEWVVSNDRKAEEGSGQEDSDTSDDDGSYDSDSSSSDDGVVFAKNNTSDSVTQSSSRYANDKCTTVNNSSPDVSTATVELQYMYIQMEFCEKSTLRHAIDNNIYKDVARVWRLFREIVEGLAHIHQQGMIHRDLKPVNIFLDSHDHVKIGDFGLATTSIIARPQTHMIVKDGVNKLLETELLSVGRVESHTGQVGTSLYVAPELNKTSGKISYTQKVDIYSLGIIFFEMCYRPLDTKMEYIEVLTDLRTSDIVIPPDFPEVDLTKQLYIIKWLLNHDPNHRPTSGDLLKCNLLPPPQMEEAELQEMVGHTLSNPQSKAYKYLIASCFQQKVSPAEDITYHMHTQIGGQHYQSCLLTELAKDTIIKIFKKHGAVSLTTPLLLPKSNLTAPSAQAGDNKVLVMTHSGSIVNLPRDLRLPFARFVAWNGITNMRRYQVDRVYRERKMFGFHPRELYECAFDIVSSSKGNLVTDAELLAVVYEIFTEFPTLKNRNCFIRLNHSSLLKSILLYCGIDESKFDEICRVLSASKDEKLTKTELETMKICQNEQVAGTLCNLFRLEEPINKILEELAPVGKRKAESMLLKQSIRDLKSIIVHAEAFGVKVPVVICPGLVYNIHQFSGMMFQFVCRLKQKKKKGLDIMAAGCRYDSLLSSFREVTDTVGHKPKDVGQQFACGLSVSLDRIVSGLIEENNEMSCVDVVVCTLGQNTMLMEMMVVVRDLWSAGIKSYVLESVESLEEIQSYCQELSIPNMILLKESETGTARVRSWERDKDRYQEKRMKTSDIVEYFNKLLNDNVDTTINVQRVDSRQSTTDIINTTTYTNSSLLNIRVVVLSKMAAGVRRRYEGQIKSYLNHVLNKFSSKTTIEVVGAFLETIVLKTLAFNIVLDQEHKDLIRSFEPVVDKYPRHKKYLMKLCDELLEINHERCVIILYSIDENMYYVLP